MAKDVKTLSRRKATPGQAGNYVLKGWFGLRENQN
jgi:hypothetical protein